nr:hypothetical protein [Pedobacter panaciterrae]
MLLFQNKFRLFTSIFFFFILYSLNLFAQEVTDTTSKVVRVRLDGPRGDTTIVILFLLDGKEMLKSEMTNINPNDVAMINVLKNDTLGKYGEKGKNGVVQIQTKAYCTQLFQQYLSGKSAEYKKMLSYNPNDQNVQYILNEKVLKDNYEGDLAGIVDGTFISINVVGAKELKAYEVTDKKYGVVIKTKPKEKTDNAF